MSMLTPKRCAVYCRVSSDERLDQSFNSIDAQRESGLSYVIYFVMHAGCLLPAISSRSCQKI